MPYLYRKRGFWYVAYRTPQGWRRESLKTKQKNIAKALLPQFTRREGAGDVPLAVADVPLDEFVAYYRAKRQSELSAAAYSSQEKYRLPIFLRFLSALGVKTLPDVRPAHVEAYVQHRRQTVSAATVKSDLFLVRHMFAAAVEWGFLADNPAEGIKPPKVADTRKSRALSEEEVERLLRAAEGLPLRSLIATAVFAGLRRGELINLEWKDVEWDAGFINVRNKKGERAFTTKSGRNRRVPLHQRLREILRPSAREEGYCFLTPRGAKWDSRNVLREFQKIVKASGVDPEQVNLHALRHTFLTMLTSRTPNLPAAQKMAGHARLSTTMRYVHVDDEVLKNEMAKWV